VARGLFGGEWNSLTARPVRPADDVRRHGDGGNVLFGVHPCRCLRFQRFRTNARPEGVEGTDVRWLVGWCFRGRANTRGTSTAGNVQPRRFGPAARHVPRSCRPFPWPGDASGRLARRQEPPAIGEQRLITRIAVAHGRSFFFCLRRSGRKDRPEMTQRSGRSDQERLPMNSVPQ